jgi:hypothetical protein
MRIGKRREVIKDQLMEDALEDNKFKEGDSENN